MQKVTVIERPVTIAPGAVLQLKKDQAASRLHSLKNLKQGLYLVEKPVQFKLGENFGYDGPIDKTLLACLDGLVLIEIEEPAGDDEDDEEPADRLQWPAGPIKANNP